MAEKTNIKKVAAVGILVADVMSPITEMPKRGELSRVASITAHNGGNAMTAALNLGRLGVESCLVGKVGDDIFGKFLIEKLIEGGVSADGVKVDKMVQTSVSIVLLDKGERSFLHCVGANATFSYKDVDFSVIEKADLVFVTGSFLMDTFDGEQTLRFLKKCKEMGKTTFLDVCWDAKGRWGEVINPALPYIDFFMPSIDEAREIAGKDGTPDEIADVFCSLGAKNIVIKLGSSGSYLRLCGEKAGKTFPPVRVDKVEDTTGAGDSFCSGFIAGYARGLAPEECMKIANAVGALCVTEKGATTGIRNFNETIKFMEEKQCL